ncbi:hypothetical protein CMI37_37500 [Candidatus Pacearchaeota archaeon]|nr:hypothetical protein [Candidatus Pacearchaeota archaeon]|tara:strand:+ start:5615 stop:5809 length:195 start_codon:yes stop_codon:yes gene_type:complete
MAATINLSSSRQASMDAYAKANGTTSTALIQKWAEGEADALAENDVNSWWNSKTLAEKEAIKAA